MSKPPRKSFQSTLEEHPEHVRAVGMISIESGSLDIVLTQLLAATLGVSESIANAIYLTPRSASARIEIFQNIVTFALENVKTDDVEGRQLKRLYEKINEKRTKRRRRIESLLARARAIADKRNIIIHEGWGVDKTTSTIIRRRLPIKPGSKATPVPLGYLTEIIRDLRVLVDDVIDLALELKQEEANAMQYMHSIGVLPLPDKKQRRSRASLGSRKIHSDLKSPGKRPRPRSSRA